MVNERSGSDKMLRRLLDFLQIMLFFLVSFGVAFNVYAFNEYRSDVAGNRLIICEAEAMRAERYCQDIVFPSIGTRP